jgi:hypothetical protein
MPRYVDEFLRSVRGDFPRVIMGDVGGHDVIAQVKRTPGWDGNIFQYTPKRAAGIYYNKTVSHTSFLPWSRLRITDFILTSLSNGGSCQSGQ